MQNHIAVRSTHIEVTIFQSVAVFDKLKTGTSRLHIIIDLYNIQLENKANEGNFKGSCVPAPVSIVRNLLLLSLGEFQLVVGIKRVCLGNR